MSGVNQRDRAIESKADRRLRELERQMQQVPSRWAQAAGSKVLQIIGGQVVSTVDVITFSASDPVLAASYDPDVDTTYPAGMGRAWLMDSNGDQLRRVLVRHDFTGQTPPLVGGEVYIARGTTLITVASGPSAGSVLTLYTVTWKV